MTTENPAAPRTYDDWLRLSDEQRDAVHAAWDAYEREGIGFALTAGGRLAISSEIPVLDIRVGVFHGGEYVLHATVNAAFIPQLPGSLEQTFEGFRVIWLPYDTSPPPQGLE